MKRLILIAIIVLTASVLYAGTCFLAGESIDGLYKTCYYDCPGGAAAITVDSYDLCPLSIDM